ncbi:MAG TPA: sensor domain-containing diguanylate cyclase [Vicinamibacterales bacterium]|nr:sensor domain-containing diguanylate cyclase [Vicinamibacterales bacterium]
MSLSASEVLARFSTQMGVPAALLQRVRGRWRFAGQSGDPTTGAESASLVRADGSCSIPDDRFCTGLVVDGLSDWVLVLPGAKEEWEARPDLPQSLEQLGEDALVMTRLQRAVTLARAERVGYLLGRRLARLTDPERIYRDITRAAAAAVKSDFAALALFVPDDGTLRIVSTYGYPQTIVEHLRVEPGEGVIGRVFASRRPFFAGVGLGAELFPPRLRYRTGSCIVIPLLSNGRSIAVLSVADPVEGDHFTREDVIALSRVAPVATLALARLSTIRDMEALAIAARVDPVTRLANRQYLIARLEAELERAQRLQQPLGMMLVDVDDFKRVNDTFGHLEGDHLLREIGALLTDNVRLFDVCTRYGGEEFAVVMPGAHESVARQVSERVREAVEQAFRGSTGGPKITLSAGVALFQPGDTASRLIGRADAALLMAKAQGKNAVRFAG